QQPRQAQLRESHMPLAGVTEWKLNNSISSRGLPLPWKWRTCCHWPAMHRLPSIAPQSIWLNGAPNWPPCVIFLIVSPFTVNGKMVVGTSMHELSTVPSISVPPPVTRQVTGWAQFTEAVHVLGAVVMALPFTSNTHGIVVLATAVPVTVTLN